MNGFSYLSQAGLVLLLLPALVLQGEGRKVPDSYYALTAAAGLAATAARHGPAAAVQSLAAGCLCLAALALAITAIRQARGLQLLTGGHIKLLAAGATWLPPLGTVAMVMLAAALLLALAAVQRLRDRAERPDFAIIATLSLMAVSLTSQWQ